MVTKYATTVNEYRESETASMRKIHAIVIFVSYMKVHLYKKCEAAQVNKLMRQIKKPLRFCYPQRLFTFINFAYGRRFNSLAIAVAS
ncbi:hypothetical protein SB6422_04440 [Klebsiella huaxiensis]|uniref:Uncharacterized protein n=1 Tax=Klebsiella huaxiensis TaxID=2153354 RepID=A0A564HRT1_9ENTR|nr:hypothetical protein SB6422_04440 [Klebsiella huaxiensis]